MPDVTGTGLFASKKMRRGLRVSRQAGRVIYARIIGAIIFVYGLVLAAAGAVLLSYGGTVYYLAAGVGTGVAGFLTLHFRRSALIVYLAVFAGTAAWAISEAGLEFWLLMPRVAAPLVVGLLLWSPWWWPVRTQGPTPRMEKHV